MKFNPFRPDKLITPGLFAGRWAELKRLERALVQTKNENPTHFAITGERGIGKSSICLFIKCVASGEIQSIQNGHFSFAVVSVTLTDDLSQSDIICCLGSELQKALKEIFNITDLAKSTWDFLSKWEILGVAYRNGEKIEAKAFELLEELSQVIVISEKKLQKEGKDGIVFLIDEADKPKLDGHLGKTLKLLTESLSKRSCNKVLFGLSGLPSVYDKLRLSHESSPRVFEPIKLLAFEPPEQIQAIDKGIFESNIKNPQRTVVQPEAAIAIAKHSEGFPNFLQQFAYSAFDADTDNSICTKDVENGAFAKGGAIDALGIRYFRDAYWSNIGSDDYRKVLKAMAVDGKKWVTKSIIRERSKIKDGILNNAIAALKERGAILPKPGKQGSYRISSEAFANWIIREKEDQ